ncbi:MAG: hypothetical protein R2932_29990 [Caldilineaceae bacterium]
MTHELSERYTEIALMASTDIGLRTPSLPLARKGLLLQRLQELHPDYARIGFVDPSGTVLLATDNLLVGANVAERSGFRLVKRHRSWAMSTMPCFSHSCWLLKLIKRNRCALLTLLHR